MNLQEINAELDRLFLIRSKCDRGINKLAQKSRDCTLKIRKLALEKSKLQTLEFEFDKES